ncbi:hypothetical protein BGZ92_006048, partial [Podila epicladia]
MERPNGAMRRRAEHSAKVQAAKVTPHVVQPKHGNEEHTPEPTPKPSPIQRKAHPTK